MALRFAVDAGSEPCLLHTVRSNLGSSRLLSPCISSRLSRSSIASREGMYHVLQMEGGNRGGGEK